MSRRAPKLTRRQRRRASKGHPPVVGKTVFIVDEAVDFHRVNRYVGFLDDANRAPGGFNVQDRQCGKTETRVNFRRYEALRKAIENLGREHMTPLSVIINSF